MKLIKQGQKQKLIIVNILYIATSIFFKNTYASGVFDESDIIPQGVYQDHFSFGSLSSEEDEVFLTPTRVSSNTDQFLSGNILSSPTSPKVFIPKLRLDKLFLFLSRSEKTTLHFDDNDLAPEK